MLGMNLLTDNW